LRKRGKPMRGARREREKKISREEQTCIYTYYNIYERAAREGRREGRRVSTFRNRKPTTAGENASRYYSRTSKVLSSRSSGSFTFCSPNPLDHPRASFLRFRDFSQPGETFLGVSRRTSELFADAEKESSTSIDRRRRRRCRRRRRRRCRCEGLRKRKSRVWTSYSTSFSPPRLFPSTEASTHNEFIKHRETAAPCGIKREKRRRKGRETKKAADDRGIFIYCYHPHTGTDGKKRECGSFQLLSLTPATRANAGLIKLRGAYISFPTARGKLS